MSTDEQITIATDLDGVQFLAPPPWKTAKRLLKGNYTLPLVVSSDEEQYQYFAGKQELAKVLVLLSHVPRPFKHGAVEAMERFRAIGQEYDRRIQEVALSGRQGELHRFTAWRLERKGYHFDDMHFSLATSSSAWKEYIVRTTDGKVVLLEDDLTAGLRAERVNLDYPEDDPKVLVYLFRNISNHPRLLRRGGVVLPETVIPVSTINQAADDFGRRVAQNRF